MNGIIYFYQSIVFVLNFCNHNETAVSGVSGVYKWHQTRINIDS